MNRAIFLIATVLPMVAFSLAFAGELPATPVCGFTVINAYPHDNTAYTQGLVYRNGTLFEGTGLTQGQSSIRRVALETGIVQQIENLDDQYFGEGVTLVGDRLIQLTWQAEIAFIWDRTTFAPLGQFNYTGSGWGLTDGAERLIMSNGSSVLRYRNADTFAVIREVQVLDGLTAVSSLNELEFIRGEILANKYGEDDIYRIRPDSGQVIARIDLTGLLDPAPDPDPPAPEVLNGIAFDEDSERLFVTGKFWPTLFEIELTGCPPLPLFSDDFASGNVLGWSAVSAN